MSDLGQPPPDRNKELQNNGKLNMNRKGTNRLLGKKPRRTDNKDDKTSQENVHRKNFRLVAYPVVFLFEILRIIAFQIWLFLTLACESAQMLSTKVRKDTITNTSKTDPDIIYLPTDTLEMAQTEKYKPPGAGEPALAKQKHHHRKAFECISKALKLDEEDEGW